MHIPCHASIVNWKVALRASKEMRELTPYFVKHYEHGA